MDSTLQIEELKRRVQMDPASIAFAVLAEEYRRAGQFEAAINTVTAGLRRHPAYPSAHITLGRALAALTRVHEAKAAFEYVLALAPENVAASRALAEIHIHADPDDRVGATPPGRSWSSETTCRVEAPPPNAALGGLEIFLQAIARARFTDVSAR